MTPDGPPPLLLFDGHCALCHGSVRWLMRRPGARSTRFAPLAGPTAAPILARHPELARVDSLIWVESPGEAEERVASESTAVLRALARTGRGWALGSRLLRLVPRPLRDALYRAVARRRRRWFGTYETCPLPPPEERQRFLP